MREGFTKIATNNNFNLNLLLERPTQRKILGKQATEDFLIFLKE